MKQFSVYGRTGYYVDLAFVNANSEIIFASIYSYSNNIEYLLKVSKKNLEIDVNNSWKKGNIVGVDNYYIKKSIQPQTDLCHIVLLKKPIVDVDKKTSLFYILSETEDLNSELVFKKISQYSTIPMKPDYANYIIDHLKNNHYIRKMRMDSFDRLYTKPPTLWQIEILDETMERILKNGLAIGALKITDTAIGSHLANEVTLDNYLPVACEQLTTRIQDNFSPKFNPLTDKYSYSLSDFEDWGYDNGKGKQLYDAQKSIIEAVVRSLKKEHRSIVVGEMGVGNR